MADTMILNLGKEHIDDVVSIVEECGPFLTLRSRSDYWAYATFFNDTCFVYSEQDQAVGVLIAYRNQNDMGQIYLQDIGVKKAYRGKGVADALITNLIEYAWSHDIGSIMLTSEPENHSALKLWERLGFENISTGREIQGVKVTEDLKGPGKHRAVFQKIID